ncbi:unnamed protein product [Heterobilharzia americana]|nr:unnamed protein product [Heterobilharzia americana]CAH8602709.1 unnamed protein product [Heterobilharzia americana]
MYKKTELLGFETIYVNITQSTQSHLQKTSRNTQIQDAIIARYCTQDFMMHNFVKKLVDYKFFITRVLFPITKE